MYSKYIDQVIAKIAAIPKTEREEVLALVHKVLHTNLSNKIGIIEAVTKTQSNARETVVLVVQQFTQEFPGCNPKKLVIALCKVDL